jgi:hypothetical protein
MSDYEDYDFGAGAPPEQKQRGLSKEVVDLIYWQVLGVGDTPPQIQTPEPDPQPTDPPARKNGQFQPGQSGNPKGRTRKQFSVAQVPATMLDQDLLAKLARDRLLHKLTINRDGVSDEKTVHEIIVEIQVMKAAKGSTSAARFLDALQARAHKAEAARQAREYAAWKDKKARYAAIHARGRKRGEGPDWDCPHPDDIILGPGHGVRVEGPMTPEALAETRTLYTQLPYWLQLLDYENWLQMRRLRRRPGCPHAHAALVSAHVFEALQRQLPPRLRLSPQEIAARMQDWQQLPGRARHDQLRAKAASLRLPVPPRALRTPFTLAHPMSEALFTEVPAPSDAAAPLQRLADQSIPELLHAAWAELMAQQVREG